MLPTHVVAAPGNSFLRASAVFALVAACVGAIGQDASEWQPLCPELGIALVQLRTSLVARPALDFDTAVNEAREDWSAIGLRGDGAPLTEDGYKEVVALKNDTEMRKLILRAVRDIGRVVRPGMEGDLTGFTPWFSGGKASQSLAAMKAELATASWLVQAGVSPASRAEDGAEADTESNSNIQLKSLAEEVDNTRRNASSEEAAATAMESNISALRKIVDEGATAIEKSESKEGTNASTESKINVWHSRMAGEGARAANESDDSKWLKNITKEGSQAASESNSSARQNSTAEEGVKAAEESEGSARLNTMARESSSVTKRTDDDFSAKGGTKIKEDGDNAGLKPLSAEGAVTVVASNSSVSRHSASEESGKSVLVWNSAWQNESADTTEAAIASNSSSMQMSFVEVSASIGHNTGTEENSEMATQSNDTERQEMSDAESVEESDDSGLLDTAIEDVAEMTMESKSSAWQKTDGEGGSASEESNVQARSKSTSAGNDTAATMRNDSSEQKAVADAGANMANDPHDDARSETAPEDTESAAAPEVLQAHAAATHESSVFSAAQSEGCDWQCYLDRYPDLRLLFGLSNTASAARHYVAYGRVEGRDCTCSEARAGDVKDVMPNVATPVQQDPQSATSPEILQAHAAATHEGAVFSATQSEACDWQCYLDRYPDLRQAFGLSNTASAAHHYVAYGRAEGRDCSCPEARAKYVQEAMPNLASPVQQDSAQDPQSATSPEILQAHAAATHEGAVFSATQSEACDWQCYLDRYPDLRQAFGLSNTASAAHHYVAYGRAEGRDCSCPEARAKYVQEAMPNVASPVQQDSAQDIAATSAVKLSTTNTLRRGES